MRHLVVLDVVEAGGLHLLALGLLDTAAGPRPRLLDSVPVSRGEAEALGRLLARVRQTEQEGRACH